MKYNCYIYHCGKCVDKYGEKSTTSVKVNVTENEPKPESVSCEECGEDAFPKATNRFNLNTGAGWPQQSTALGCHPCQVKDFTERASEIGCPTEFLPSGEAVMRNRSHRKNYMKALAERNHDKIIDYSGGYGDYTG